MRLLSALVIVLAACVSTPPGPRAGERCTYRIDVLAPEAEGCTIDERVSSVPGVAGFDCGGGPVDVTFGSNVFQGNVARGVLDASLETEFDYEDGCRWKSTQRLSGAMRPGAVLTYTYEEAPIGGADCASSCRATSVATVH